MSSTTLKRQDLHGRSLALLLVEVGIDGRLHGIYVVAGTVEADDASIRFNPEGPVDAVEIPERLHALIQPVDDEDRVSLADAAADYCLRLYLVGPPDFNTLDLNDLFATARET